MKGIFDIDNPIMSGVIKIFDCICVSLLWLLFSLPVITIGASSAALYTTVYKYLRKDEGHLWRTFWTAFRENLRRSTLVWLAALAVMGVLIADALVCIAVTWMMYLSAYAARFSGSAKDVLWFGTLLLALHPIKAVCVFLPLLCGGVLVLVGPGLIAIVPAAVCWLDSITLEKVFLLHMKPEDIEKTMTDMKIK